MSLKEIAAEVGVSISTVSRVLNTEGSTAAGKDLQRKIWEVAKKQGYMPDLTARRLKKSNLPDTAQPHFMYCIYACPPQETKDDPFFSKLLEAVEHEAFKRDYVLKYTFSANAVDTLMATPESVRSDEDCLVILGRFQIDFLMRLKKIFKKIVYVGLNILDVPCDQIVCNSYNIALDIVNYFYSLNHRKIGFIGSTEGRYRGYKDAMRSLDLPIDDRYIISDSMLSMEGGYQGMQRLLEQAPDVSAVLCANDMISIGALRACKDKGIRVPDDISLLGINDIENIQYTDPMLSSFHVPLDEMGRMAVTILLDRTQGGHSSHIKVEFPYTLVKRESCKTFEPKA